LSLYFHNHHHQPSSIIIGIISINNVITIIITIQLLLGMVHPWLLFHDTSTFGIIDEHCKRYMQLGGGVGLGVEEAAITTDTSSPPPPSSSSPTPPRPSSSSSVNIAGQQATARQEYSQLIAILLSLLSGANQTISRFAM